MLPQRLSGVVRRGVARSVRYALALAQEHGVQVQAPLVRLNRTYPEATNAMLRNVAPFTMTPPSRLVALRDAVEYIVAAAVPGAIVECGVWRGGSMMAVAHTLLELDAADRELWLYDTFEGMTEPTAHDRTAGGRAAKDWIDRERTTQHGHTTGVFRSSRDEVAENLATTGYPAHLIRLVPGRVEDTLTYERPDRIALLRLDTDFYESTRVELEALYPLVASDGVLILDDYGYWHGARRAVDDYFRNQPKLLIRIDSSGRIAVGGPKAGRGSLSGAASTDHGSSHE